jgi:hypothetical protein
MSTTVNRKRLKRAAKMQKYYEDKEGIMNYKFVRERLMTRKQRIKRNLRQTYKK